MRSFIEHLSKYKKYISHSREYNMLYTSRSNNNNRDKSPKEMRKIYIFSFCQVVIVEPMGFSHQIDFRPNIMRFNSF